MEDAGESPKGLINGSPLNNIHSCVIVVVTPGELAGHCVLLETRLSTDQCKPLCAAEERKKEQTNVNQTRKNSSSPKYITLLKVAYV